MKEKNAPVFFDVRLKVIISEGRLNTTPLASGILTNPVRHESGEGRSSSEKDIRVLRIRLL